MERKNNFSPVIGLEIHLELTTASKMFCPCPADHFGKEPNTQTCPVCLGLPGALPVPNKEAIRRTLLLALALNCQINTHTWFDRKNYFYPDLPKGYQISQFFKPLGINGQLALSSGKKINIREIHLEEDTAKSLHRDGHTLLDFNKSGVPLVEIVSEPDLSSAEEAVEYAKALHTLIRKIKISPADMEKGQLRLEANISLKKDPKDPLPKYKVEVKNINSFKFLKDAITYEIKRQKELLENNKKIIQETRGYDAKNKKTFSQRTKEEAYEYRYFPEPDIPPLNLEEIFNFDKLKKEIPELPEQTIRRLETDYQLAAADAQIFSKSKKALDYFEKAVKFGQKENIGPQQVANIIINKRLPWEKLSPQELILKIKGQKEQALVGGGELENIIKGVIAKNPQAVADFKKGKENALGFLIGQIQKETKGKADVRQAQEMLRRELTRMKSE
jgi:aspartyl-tRNA(Asn)/glutamyl-tRNA(Gln) amidotransferase subunit B